MISLLTSIFLAVSIFVERCFRVVANGMRAPPFCLLLDRVPFPERRRVVASEERQPSQDAADQPLELRKRCGTRGSVMGNDAMHGRLDLFYNVKIVSRRRSQNWVEFGRCFCC